MANVKLSTMAEVCRKMSPGISDKDLWESVANMAGLSVAKVHEVLAEEAAAAAAGIAGYVGIVETALAYGIGKGNTGVMNSLRAARNASGSGSGLGTVGLRLRAALGACKSILAIAEADLPSTFEVRVCEAIGRSKSKETGLVSPVAKFTGAKGRDLSGAEAVALAAKWEPILTEAIGKWTEISRLNEEVFQACVILPEGAKPVPAEDDDDGEGEEA